MSSGLPQPESPQCRPGGSVGFSDADLAEMISHHVLLVVLQIVAMTGTSQHTQVPKFLEYLYLHIIITIITIKQNSLHKYIYIARTLWYG